MASDTVRRLQKKLVRKKPKGDEEWGSSFYGHGGGHPADVPTASIICSTIDYHEEYNKQMGLNTTRRHTVSDCGSFKCSCKAKGLYFFF